MRELSEQETESVSGGIAEVTANWVPVDAPNNQFHNLHYGRLAPKIVVPNLNLIEDHFFKNNPDS